MDKDNTNGRSGDEAIDDGCGSRFDDLDCLQRCRLRQHDLLVIDVVGKNADDVGSICNIVTKQIPIAKLNRQNNECEEGVHPSYCRRLLMKIIIIYSASLCPRD